MYWIVIYLYRRIPSREWNIANEVHKGPLSEWFAEQREYVKAGTPQESKLVNALPISEEEYLELKDHLS